MSLLTDMNQPPKKVSLFNTFKSILAAFFGVQTEQNRERDFTQGNPLHFIVAGLIATALFILVLVIIVQLVLSAASG